jgi:xanthine dehydrogenase accessory factor
VSALAKMGLFLEFDVIVLSPDLSDLDLDQKVTKITEFSSVEGPCMAVVATQGNGDLRALKAAIASKPEFLSLIASKKKTKSLLERLERRSIQPEQIERIKFPAGLDIGAVTPEEIAVSIMAELVQKRREITRKDEIIIETLHHGSGKEKDPICGMFVDPGTADCFSIFENVTYYFCCGGCKDRFEAEPSSYIQI